MRIELILSFSTRNIPTKGKSSVFPVGGNLSPLRVAPQARVCPGVPRLLHNVVTLRIQDHVGTPAVGSGRQERVEVLLLQVLQP
jgi:hypothetical protein